MPHIRCSRLVGELTFLQVPALLKETSILCLPIGSFEQHGPHLPLNTDIVLAEALTKIIISRWGDNLDLWQLPTVSISLAREHEWAPGTLSLSVDGITKLLHDLGRGIARALPARNLAIVNCHGGNRGILEALARDLLADFGLNVCILNPGALAAATKDLTNPDIHAGKTETSMMLAIAPQLVHQDLIAQLKHPPAADAVRNAVLLEGVTWPWSTNDERIADMGVIGDPQGASAELGRSVLDHVVEMAGSVLRELSSKQRLSRPA